jgi:hypothetical protein
VGSGWLVAPNRAPFFIGATPASCELRVARSALARGETEISLQGDARAYDGLQVHNRVALEAQETKAGQVRYEFFRAA